MKPDCYQCIHRRDVLGSRHSSCHHPSVRAVSTDPLVELIGLLGTGSGFEGLPLDGPAATLQVTGHAHGRRNGWFLWPVNFDPVWLQTCQGFEPREA